MSIVNLKLIEHDAFINNFKTYLNDQFNCIKIEIILKSHS